LNVKRHAQQINGIGMCIQNVSLFRAGDIGKKATLLATLQVLCCSSIHLNYIKGPQTYDMKKWAP